MHLRKEGGGEVFEVSLRYAASKRGITILFASAHASTHTNTSTRGSPAHQETTYPVHVDLHLALFFVRPDQYPVPLLVS